MTDKLPPNLLKLFAPRPPLPYFEPLDRAPAERTGPTISGVAMFMSEFGNHDQDYVGTQTAETRRVEKVHCVHIFHSPIMIIRFEDSKKQPRKAECVSCRNGIVVISLERKPVIHTRLCLSLNWQVFIGIY